MITDFDDFCLWIYVIVDDIFQQIEFLFKCPGPKPYCSDSELIAMAIIGECRGWDQETELLANFRLHQDLFPDIPSQSRFNRRRRNLTMAFNLIRQIILKQMEIALDDSAIIDSLPIPVVQFYLVPGSTGDWTAYGATFGKVPSKKEIIYGYKLHLLISLEGLILDFELAPANETDLNVGYELLLQHTDLCVFGDKAYISQEKTEELWRKNRLRLLSLPRKNQKKTVSPEMRKLFNRIRQKIETVNNQLSNQFNIEVNHAHTFWGLCTRLYTKLTAHTISIYLNRLLGNKDFLQIKALAFPELA